MTLATKARPRQLQRYEFTTANSRRWTGYPEADAEEETPPPQQERDERMRSTMGGGMFDPATRTGIFGPKTGQVGNQKSVSPKEAINLREASGEDDRELRKPN